MKRASSGAGAAEARKRPRKSEADMRQAKFEEGHDYYCWSCHKEKASHSCATCARSFHGKCLNQAGQRKATDEVLVCHECKRLQELAKKPARALRSLSPSQLNHLILEVVESVKQTADPSFHQPVLLANYPDFEEKIIHAISFQDVEQKCAANAYQTPQEMLADLAWILHNSFIYNSASHALTANAKQFVKLATGKVVDLEMCPDCFNHFKTKPATWFLESCSKPHVLVSARVAGQFAASVSCDATHVATTATGYPFWPAKLVGVDRREKVADVRFFGSGHERSVCSLALLSR